MASFVNLTLNAPPGSKCSSKCASSHRVRVSGCSSTLMWRSTICCKQVKITVVRPETFLGGRSPAMRTSSLDLWHIYPPASSVSTAAPVSTCGFIHPWNLWICFSSRRLSSGLFLFTFSLSAFGGLIFSFKDFGSQALPLMHVRIIWQQKGKNKRNSEET